MGKKLACGLIQSQYTTSLLLFVFVKGRTEVSENQQITNKEMMESNIPEALDTCLKLDENATKKTKKLEILSIFQRSHAEGEYF